MPATAEATHAVLQTILSRLNEGTLARITGHCSGSGGRRKSIDGRAYRSPMQANHGSFEGLAMLGSSVSCTRLPARNRSDDICLFGKTDPTEGLSKFAQFNWRYAFHWEDVAEQFAAVETSTLAATSMPYWGSETSPNAGGGLLPANFAMEAARITVPVLLAMGERDVTQDPLREMAAFISASDLAYFVAPRMAHMHNFAGTRTQLWSRLSSFIAQVADLRGCH